MPDPAEQIDQVLADPAAFTSDGQSTTSRPIGDVIQGLNYQESIAAIKERRRGIHFSQLITPGAHGDSGGCSPGHGGGC